LIFRGLDFGYASDYWIYHPKRAIYVNNCCDSNTIFETNVKSSVSLPAITDCYQFTLAALKLARVLDLIGFHAQLVDID